MIRYGLKTIILFFFTNLLVNHTLFAQSERLNEIEEFWRILFKEYHFGYTLFGDKPISFDRYYVYDSNKDFF